MISGMLNVEQAQALVMAEIETGPAEDVPLAEAGGRLLREEVIAVADMPAADNSAMDGYAVRAVDIEGAPVRLEVSGDIPAGHPSSTPLAPGTAMRIMTGAFLPDGADTVVQVELTDGGTEVVAIDRSLPGGTNVRSRGGDVRAGEVVLREGCRIGPPELAMLAAMRKSIVTVARRPRVAILTTGDELIDVADEPVPGKIVDTNRYLLSALVRETGATPQPIGIVGDTLEATVAAFEAALECELILSSGGVSVGAWDFVKEALEVLGAETKFWRVAMKPGKPIVLSRLRDRVVFGLPGNPVSCFVSFHIFVAPALRKWMGQASSLLPPAVRATLTSPLRSAADRRVYYRVRVESYGRELAARPLATQGSGSLTSMLGANGLAIVEQGVPELEAGAPVDCLLIGSLAS